MADKVTVIQGENIVFTIKLRDSEGDPFSLASFNKYKVCLPGADGTPIEVTEVANANGSIVTVDGNNILGRLQVQLTAVDTALLLVEERTDIDLEIDNAGSPAPRKAKFRNVLTVLDSLC